VFIRRSLDASFSSPIIYTFVLPALVAVKRKVKKIKMSPKIKKKTFDARKHGLP